MYILSSRIWAPLLTSVRANGSHIHQFPIQIANKKVMSHRIIRQQFKNFLIFIISFEDVSFATRAILREIDCYL